jgi:hypothetical protein
MVPKIIADGPMNMALFKKKTKKKSYEHTHELINMNHTIIDIPSLEAKLESLSPNLIFIPLIINSKRPYSRR